MVYLKSKSEIEIMKRNGKIVAEVLQLVGESMKPGMTTLELDRIAEDFMLKNDAKPAFYGYRGYPANICVSIDEEVVHGIPGKRQLRSGQIVSIDIGVLKEGYYADGAATFSVDGISSQAQQLLEVTKQALESGLAEARPGKYLGDISFAIQSHTESKGYSVVRELVGHGIGRAMHEDPSVPNYGSPASGLLLKSGMVLAIEPMVNIGTYEVVTKADGWTIVTADGSLSAHFEHTVAITEDGPMVLTSLN